MSTNPHPILTDAEVEDMINDIVMVVPAVECPADTAITWLADEVRMLRARMPQQSGRACDKSTRLLLSWRSRLLEISQVLRKNPGFWHRLDTLQVVGVPREPGGVAYVMLGETADGIPAFFGNFPRPASHTWFFVDGRPTLVELLSEAIADKHLDGVTSYYGVNAAVT